MIRKGTIGDAAQMAEIFNHYVETSEVIFSNRILTEADMRERLEPVVGKYPFFTDENSDGLLTGYCYAHAFHPDPVYGATWELTEYLRHGHTGGGIGTALLRTTIEECRRAGAHTLIATVTAGNEPCERMLARLGFRQAGILRDAGFKFGRYLDDVFFQLML